MSLDDEWQPSPAPCPEESTETTTRMSEGIGRAIAVALLPKEMAFSSRDALDDYLDNYTAPAFQVFCRRTDTSVEERNSKIDSTHPTATKIPADLIQYAKTFVYTHHGKYTSQASGMRPRQVPRGRGCLAKTTVTACV
ncbi:hypothetical protein PI126_g20015 [Phytophthora idaei]|nr:hypothetical protein PI126_g20015 [Phytophthora idaei]